MSLSRWRHTCLMLLAGLMLGGCVAVHAQPPAASQLPDDWYPLTPWNMAEVAVMHTLHVSADPTVASDDHPGSAEQPLRSIQRAIELAQAHARAGEGTRVVIAPGVYRETLDIVERGSNPPLVIEAREAGTVVVSGSDVFDAWEPVADGVWEHAWAHRFGWVDNPWPGLMPLEMPGLRRELLFVDGRPLRQVFDAAALAAGTYLVDEDAGRLRMMPPEGVALAGAMVEVSVRPVAAYGEHSKLLRAMRVENLTLRGLVFEHAASLPFNDPAVTLRQCRNVVIEDCVIRYNGGVGLGGSLTNATLRRVIASHNGTQGMDGTYSNTLMEHGQTSDNNWRGALYGATGWAPCGFKFAGSQGLVIRDHHASRNHASGGWFDDSNQHVLIERFTAVNNYRSGISLEANVGPVVIRDSVLAGNSVGLNGFDNINVSVIGSIIVDNHRRQVRLAGSTPLTAQELERYTGWRKHRLSGRRPPTDWHFSDTVIAAGPSHDGAVMMTYWMRGSYQGSDGSDLIDQLNASLRLDEVTFWHPTPEAPLFPEARGEHLAWSAWETMLIEPRVRWSREGYDRALAKALRRAGEPISGFGATGQHLDDPGL